jgi:hypothetical protein
VLTERAVFIFVSFVAMRCGAGERLVVRWASTGLGFMSV